MKCPLCGFFNPEGSNKVTNSRPLKRQNATKRTRECKHCGGRFRTVERIAGD